jgi:hypothetical protein
MLTPEAAHQLFQQQIDQKKSQLEADLHTTYTQKLTPDQAMTATLNLYSKFWRECTDLELEISEQTKTDDARGIPVIEVACDALPWLAAVIDFGRLLHDIGDLLKNEGADNVTLNIFQQQSSVQREGSIFSDELIELLRGSKQNKYRLLQESGLVTYMINQVNSLIDTYPYSPGFYKQSREVTSQQYEEYSNQLSDLLNYFLLFL